MTHCYIHQFEHNLSHIYVELTIKLLSNFDVKLVIQNIISLEEYTCIASLNYSYVPHLNKFHQYVENKIIKEKRKP